MWKIDGREYALDFFAGLNPEEVLLEYDGPRLFVSKTRDGLSVLVHQTDEDNTQRRFLVVPIATRLLGELRSGQVRLRAALTRSSWCWLVDTDLDGNPVSAWSVAPESIPQDVLPRAWVALSPVEGDPAPGRVVSPEQQERYQRTQAAVQAHGTWGVKKAA